MRNAHVLYYAKQPLNTTVDDEIIPINSLSTQKIH